MAQSKDFYITNLIAYDLNSQALLSALGFLLQDVSQDRDFNVFIRFKNVLQRDMVPQAIKLDCIFHYEQLLDMRVNPDESCDEILWNPTISGRPLALFLVLQSSDFSSIFDIMQIFSSKILIGYVVNLMPYTDIFQPNAFKCALLKFPHLPVNKIHQQCPYSVSLILDCTVLDSVNICTHEQSTQYSIYCNSLHVPLQHSIGINTFDIFISGSF